MLRSPLIHILTLSIFLCIFFISQPLLISLYHCNKPNYPEAGCIICYHWFALNFNRNLMSNTHKILLTLKHKLLHGSKNRLGSVDNSLHQIELKIKAFEIKESFAPNSMKDLTSLCYLQNKYTLSKHIHLKWSMRAKAKLLLDADKITKYFHHVVKRRKRTNYIHFIHFDNGASVEDMRPSLHRLIL